MCQQRGQQGQREESSMETWLYRRRKGRKGQASGQVEEGSQDEKKLEKEEGASSGTGHEEDFGFVL